jgi:hypothetical protein
MAQPPPPRGKDAKAEGRDPETPMERFKALSRRLLNVSNAEVHRHMDQGKQTDSRKQRAKPPD